MTVCARCGEPVTASEPLELDLPEAPEASARCGQCARAELEAK